MAGWCMLCCAVLVIIPAVAYAVQVLTNVLVICFTSEQLAMWLPSLFRAASEEDVAAGR